MSIVLLFFFFLHRQCVNDSEGPNKVILYSTQTQTRTSGSLIREHQEIGNQHMDD